MTHTTPVKRPYINDPTQGPGIDTAAADPVPDAAAAQDEDPF